MTNAKGVLEWMEWEKKRKANMTNEEWLEQASTEEKAKFLANSSKFLYECGERQSTPKIMYEEDWETWLKEKHYA